MSVYKGNKLVAGGSIDTHFVRKPAWNQAVEISTGQLYAGYTAPSDGMFVCTGVMPTANNDIHKVITVNNVPIVKGQYNSANVFSYGNTSCPVSKGDLIKANTDKSWEAEARYFVPFEDSTVSESDIEVVTPELIRNLHDPDWSQAEATVDIRTSRTWTATKRGVIVSKIRHNAENGYIKVNGVIVNACENAGASEYNVTPVSPGDIVTEEPAGATFATIQFVPYKAQ